MKIEKIKDVNGMPYLSLELGLDSVDSDGKSLRSMYELYKANVKDHELMTDNLMIRNGYKYHITVFNVAECMKMSPIHMGLLLDYNIDDLKFLGVGSVKDNEVWFVVVESEQLNILRTFYPKRDLHVTLGFKHKDYFKEPKDRSSIQYIDCINKT